MSNYIDVLFTAGNGNGTRKVRVQAEWSHVAAAALRVAREWKVYAVSADALSEAPIPYWPKNQTALREVRRATYWFSAQELGDRAPGAKRKKRNRSGYAVEKPYRPLRVQTTVETVRLDNGDTLAVEMNRVGSKGKPLTTTTGLPGTRGHQTLGGEYSRRIKSGRR